MAHDEPYSLSLGQRLGDNQFFVTLGYDGPNANKFGDRNKKDVGSPTVIPRPKLPVDRLPDLPVARAPVSAVPLILADHEHIRLFENADSGNLTMVKADLLTKNKLSEIIVTVHEKSVEVSVDGREVIKWTASSCRTIDN